MPFLNGISYTEIPGSGTVDYSPDGIVGRRQFLIAWADRRLFCQTLLGYTTVTGHLPLRTQAQKFPEWDYLYCTHAREKPLGTLSYDDDGASYPQVQIHAEYHSRNIPTSTVDQDEEYDEEVEQARLYVEESYEFGAEFVHGKGAEYIYETGTAVEQDVGLLIGTMEMQLHSPWDPELQVDKIQTCIGKVNSTRFYNYPAEQVLFMGASAQRVITSEGVPGWAVTYRFRAKSVSFNKVYRGATTEVVGMTTYIHLDGWWPITPKPYLDTNFGILFDA